MADQRLNIIFSGDASQLNQTISTTEAKLQGLSTSLEKGVGNNAFTAATQSAGQFSQKIKEVDNVVKKNPLGTLSNSAKFFGQAINDAKDKVETLRAKLLSLSTVGLKSSFGRNLSAELVAAKAQLRSLETQAGISSAGINNSLTKAFSGLRTLANILPGIGIGGLVGLAASAVNSLADGFFEAAFGASKFHKAIDDAAGSIDREAVSVITMVEALQSGTLSSSEFKKVKAELIAQAPEFQKSFNGDKISIDASDLALTKYITKLTTTVRITAALAIVNDTLAKSIATIAKGGVTTVLEDITSLFSKLNPTKPIGLKITDPKAESLKKALESLNPENVAKLIDDTFKKIGLSFKDFADGIDDDALKKKLAKIKADFEKFQAEVIAKARLFSKEFGNAFVVPDLEETFFTTKQQIFVRAKRLLDDIAKNNLKIKLPIEVESSQISETVTKDINNLNKVIESLKPVSIDVTSKGIEEVKKNITDIKDKTVTISVKQLGEVSLGDLKDKEITISINQQGDVKKIAEQLTKLKGVEVPIVIEQQGDVNKIIKELSSLKGVDIPIKISKEGDIKEIVTELGKLKGVDINVSAKGVDLISKQLASLKQDIVVDVSSKGVEEVRKSLLELKDKKIVISLEQLGDVSLDELKDKEISIKINQEGDVKKIAEQLTQLKGVDIPIVVEQKGNIEKIAEQLENLRGKTIPIKIVEQGNIQSIVDGLKGIKDVQIQVSATQNVDEALKDIETLIKGKEFPIIINQDGIIFQISKAVDGAISIVKTKQIIIPVVTEFDFQPESKSGVTKEIEDNFFKGLKLERGIPVEIVPNFTLPDADQQKKLDDLLKGFAKFGKIGFEAFEKVDFSNFNKGLEEAARKLKNIQDLTAVLTQSIGGGLANAFNNVFDAILEGKSVFKALGESVKQLVVQTAKAVVQMIILKAVTKGLSGSSVPIPTGGGGGIANPSSFGGIGGSRAAQTLTTRVSGTDLVFVLNQGQRIIGG